MFEGAVAMERAACVGQVEFAEVFGDDDGAGREQGETFTAEQGEGGRVFFGVVVGRVEEDDVGFGFGSGETAERDGDAVRVNGVAAADAEGGEVGADGAQGRRRVFDEDDVGGAAAYGFDTDGS